jgi:hypothetical protein
LFFTAEYVQNTGPLACKTFNRFFAILLVKDRLLGLEVRGLLQNENVVHQSTRLIVIIAMFQFQSRLVGQIESIVNVELVSQLSP